MESKFVLLSLSFVIQFVFFNVVGYGIIIYTGWEALGKIYDLFEWYELFIPCAIATFVSMLSTSLTLGVDVDW